MGDPIELPVLGRWEHTQLERSGHHDVLPPPPHRRQRRVPRPHDSNAGQFEIRYRLAGTTFSTTCDGDVLQPFTCSVDTGGLVTWTDQQTSAYFIGRVLTGDDQYVGRSTGLADQLTDTSGDILVVAYLNRIQVVITRDRI